MGLIYRNSFASVKVPSSMELANRFGVTRRTARMALESLIAEGYLTSKSGIGTFTNPVKGFKLGNVRQKPLIGLCFGDGSHFYYDAYTGKIFADVMSRLLDAGYNVYPLVHTSTDPEAMIAEVEYAGLDGAVFCNPNPGLPAVQYLLEAGKPCVAIRYESAGADFVLPFTGEAFLKLITEAENAGNKRITVLISENPGNWFEDGIAWAKKQKNSPVITEVIKGLNPAIYDNTLTGIFSRKDEEIPDMLIVSWRAPQTAREIMAQCGVAPERCKIVVDGAFSLPEDFSGYDITVSYHDMADAAVELLERRFRQPELPPQTTVINGNLIRIDRKGGRHIL